MGGSPSSIDANVNPDHEERMGIEFRKIVDSVISSSDSVWRKLLNNVKETEPLTWQELPLPIIEISDMSADGRIGLTFEAFEKGSIVKGIDIASREFIGFLQTLPYNSVHHQQPLEETCSRFLPRDLAKLALSYHVDTVIFCIHQRYTMLEQEDLGSEEWVLTISQTQQWRHPQVNTCLVYNREEALRLCLSDLQSGNLLLQAVCDFTHQQLTTYFENHDSLRKVRDFY